MIVCPHGTTTEVSFTAAHFPEGFAIAIDAIGCAACLAKLVGGGAAAVEYQRLVLGRVAKVL